MSCPECGSTRTQPSDLGPAFECCSSCGKLWVKPEEPQVQQPAEASATPTDAYDPEIPVYAEVFTGWRAWGVPMLDSWVIPKLQSVTHKEAKWLPRQVCEARCLRAEAAGTSRTPGRYAAHHIPEEKCSCGLYAAKSLEQLKRLRYSQYNEDRDGYFKVVGEVSMWGKVIEGSQGWKSQYAYPRHLYVPYEAWRLVEPLKDAYGVPVTLDNLWSLG